MDNKKQKIKIIGGSVQVSHTSVAGIQKATKVDEGIISEVTLKTMIRTEEGDLKIKRYH